MVPPSWLSRAEHGGRVRGGVGRPPPGEAEVVVGDAGLGPDHEEQHAGDGGEDDDRRHGQREGEAGGDLGIQPRPPYGPAAAPGGRPRERAPGSRRLRRGAAGSWFGQRRHDGPGEKPGHGADAEDERGPRPRPGLVPPLDPGLRKMSVAGAIRGRMGRVGTYAAAVRLQGSGHGDPGNHPGMSARSLPTARSIPPAGSRARVASGRRRPSSSSASWRSSRPWCWSACCSPTSSRRNGRALGRSVDPLAGDAPRRRPRRPHRGRCPARPTRSASSPSPSWWSIVLGIRRRWAQLAILVTGLTLELSVFLAVNAIVGRHRPDVRAPGRHAVDRQLPVRPHGGHAGSLRRHRPHRERDGPGLRVAGADLARGRADAGRRRLRPGVPRLSPSDRRVLRCAARVRRARWSPSLAVRRWAPDADQEEVSDDRRQTELPHEQRRWPRGDHGQGRRRRPPPQDARWRACSNCAASCTTPGSPTRPGSRCRRARRRPKQVRAAVKQGAELLLVWGGDGMVQRCIDACWPRRCRANVTVGIIPAGTANLLATNLGIPHDLDEALDIALAGPEPPARRRGRQRRALRGHGRSRFRRPHDRRRRPRQPRPASVRLAYVRTGASAIRADAEPVHVLVDGVTFFEGAGQLRAGRERAPGDRRAPRLQRRRTRRRAARRRRGHRRRGRAVAAGPDPGGAAPRRRLTLRPDAAGPHHRRPLRSARRLRARRRDPARRPTSCASR